MSHQRRARLERRRALAADVGKAPAPAHLYEAERQVSGLQHARRTEKDCLYRRGFCRWSYLVNRSLLTTGQCNAIHKTIVEQFKHAIVYGQSVKHQPQRVGLSHELGDEDISRLLKDPSACLILIVCSHNHKTMITANEPFRQSNSESGIVRHSSCGLCCQVNECP